MTGVTNETPVDKVAFLEMARMGGLRFVAAASFKSPSDRYWLLPVLRLGVTEMLLLLLLPVVSLLLDVSLICCKPLGPSDIDLVASRDPWFIPGDCFGDLAFMLDDAADCEDRRCGMAGLLRFEPTAKELFLPALDGLPSSAGFGEAMDCTVLKFEVFGVGPVFGDVGDVGDWSFNELSRPSKIS